MEYGRDSNIRKRKDEVEEGEVATLLIFTTKSKQCYV